jgi:hypothetical protein
MLRTGLAVGLVLSVAGAARAGDAAEARKVIDKAIAASGGAANLAKNKAVTWKGKGTFYGMGEGVPYVGAWSMELPTKLRMEIENVFVLVVDGDKGWTRMGDATQEMSKEQLDEQKQGLYCEWVASLLPFLDKDKAKDLTLSLLPEEKVDNKPAAGVKVTQQGKRDVSLYFDKDSGLLVKSVFDVKDDASGNLVKQEAYYSNYKDVQGIKLAFKNVVKREGKPFVDGELFDYKGSEKLPENTFAKP